MLCDHVGARRHESVDKRCLADYCVPKCDKMCQSFERLSVSNVYQGISTNVKNNCYQLININLFLRLIILCGVFLNNNNNYNYNNIIITIL